MLAPLLFALAGLSGVRADALKLNTKWQGSTFFDGWNVNASETDPTQYGNIHYLNQSAATAAQLIYVNSAGHAILKVDNTTNDPAPGPYSTFGRNSVLLKSKELVDIGTLVVLDAVHIPYGCSVWPAFWTLDNTTSTDEGGEIDIVEAVNLMTDNQFSLHAKQGCNLVNSTSMPYTGTVVYTDCNYVFNVTGNRGCGIKEKVSNNGLGAAFAANGGGVYAMYWSTAGIQMWFFERTRIPQDLATESPDPTSWPTPTAAFPAAGCDPRAFFNAQNMILNIDICGAWAANADVYPTTGCTGKCTDLVGTASNYDQAYWEINYVKTYTAAGSSSASASATASGSATGSGAAGSGGATDTGSGAVPTVSQGSGAGRVGAAGAALGVLVLAALAAVVA